MIHGKAAAETARSCWILGKAMFAMESSRTSISCADAMTIKDRPSPRPPGDVLDDPACMGNAVFDIEALPRVPDRMVGALPTSVIYPPGVYQPLICAHSDCIHRSAWKGYSQKF